MIKPFDCISRFFARFRYPVTLPEDVAETLGVQVSNFLSYEELLQKISTCECNPLRLARFMPRNEAESAFKHATCIERFGSKTLISYYFSEGWVGFVLQFDSHMQLRRIYLRHNEIKNEEGLEINLCSSYIGHRLVQPTKSLSYMR